jgi:hypothetical protein
MKDWIKNEWQSEGKGTSDSVDEWIKNESQNEVEESNESVNDRIRNESDSEWEEAEWVHEWKRMNERVRERKLLSHWMRE